MWDGGSQSLKPHLAHSRMRLGAAFARDPCNHDERIQLGEQKEELTIKEGSLESQTELKDFTPIGFDSWIPSILAERLRSLLDWLRG